MANREQMTGFGLLSEVVNVLIAGFAALDAGGRGAAAAYVATGQNFPDALAGAALAGSGGAPVVLVAVTASRVRSGRPWPR